MREKSKLRRRLRTFWSAPASSRRVFGYSVGKDEIMIFTTNRFPIRIVSRPKLSGIGEHWGVQLPDGNVAHLTPRGEKIVLFVEFAQGRPVKEVRRAEPDQYAQIIRRVTLSIKNPGQYRLLDRNCETYATWLIGEKPQSPQVAGVVLVGLMAAFLRFA
jgi:hypothetical protein